MLCSDRFVPMAKAEAAALGLPGLPIIIVDHPIGGRPPEVVELRADQAFPQLVAVVTQSGQPVEARG